MELTQEQAMEVLRKAKPIAKMLNDELRKAGDLSSSVFGLVIAGQLWGVATENHLDVDKVCDDIFRMIRDDIHLIAKDQSDRAMQN